MSAKPFTREDAIALFTEMLDQAIAGGKTCAQLAEKNEKARFFAAQELDAIRREAVQRASEEPIPPYVAVTVSPTCRQALIKTPVIYEVGPNGYRLAVAGGFAIAKDGHASRIELPKSDVDAWCAGGDPVFAKLVADGDLVLAPMTEAEARPIEELARRFRSKGEAMAKTTVGNPQFGASRAGVFQGS